ncbi:hypothetical protein P344_00885 [Spiroplasma mirum ATCC 29335]|uniref:Uncharacterized protein n=1 Tax=Spiroplasma mirum ATCC 29335 TaxID=838561 RepID=W6ALH3_9MOLU|nr:hypothetical protein P344_00885 [Spiroplasma mirum ATCC 29335]
MIKQYIKPDKDDKMWIYDNGQKTKNFKTKEK